MVVDGQPRFFSEHCRRLERDARVLGLAWSGEAELLRRVQACLAANGVREAAMKVFLFKDVEGSTELVQLRASSPLEAVRARGCRLLTLQGPCATVEVAGHKTSSYLAHLLARRVAAERGCDEALWVDTDGSLLECAGANVFVVHQNRLLTPSLCQALLPGVIREIIVRDLPGAAEARITQAMLAEASEVFLTNSLIGAIPVQSCGALRWEVARAEVCVQVNSWLAGKG
jgi:branched-subunit amino acid aminotransferase/4-amino-4-deoxychorismate lyase